MAADSGNLAIDPRTNEVTWTMRALPRDKAPELTGTAYLAPGAGAPVESLHASLSFAVGGVTVSGLNVRELNLAGAPYKFFKGERAREGEGVGTRAAPPRACTCARTRAPPPPHPAPARPPRPPAGVKTMMRSGRIQVRT